MNDDFVGSGWAFPISTDSTGRIALVSGDREIEESIRLILSTAPAERPMRPEFGCRIQEHVFAPIEARTLGRIAAEVRESLRRWEPRINVLEVDVSPDDEGSSVQIGITYSIRDTNDPRNLVFPFYLIPSAATQHQPAPAARAEV